MMKKMKSMSAEAAAVRRLVLLSDEDDELNRNDRTAQQEFMNCLAVRATKRETMN